MTLKCEDNYFGRKLHKNTNETFFETFTQIRLTILESRVKRQQQQQQQATLFLNDTFSFKVDEGFAGPIGQLSNFSGLTFQFEGGQDSKFFAEHFAVDSTNATVYVTKPFDYESGDYRFAFEITAQNVTSGGAGSVPQRASVRLEINDVSDETPAFIQSEFKIFVRHRLLRSSAAQQVSSIGQVYAIDTDKVDFLDFSVLEINTDSGGESSGFISGIDAISLDSSLDENSTNETTTTTTTTTTTISTSSSSVKLDILFPSTSTI